MFFTSIFCGSAVHILKELITGSSKGQDSYLVSGISVLNPDIS